MLAIDIGNSRVKWGVFSEIGLQSHGVFYYDKNNIEVALNKYGLVKKIGKVIVSCVAGASIEKQFAKWLKANGCMEFEFVVTAKQQCGIVNSYQQPTKMGVDRWLAMIAANKLYGANKASLLCVIDCGTAITLDVLNAEGEHLGGLILPGYQTMIASLGLNTGNIIDTQGESLRQSLNVGLGVSTDEAVSKGCAQIISAGIGAMLAAHAGQKNNDINCVVTGGDGAWLSESLPWKVRLEPYLVLQGLYFTSYKNKA